MLSTMLKVNLQDFVCLLILRLALWLGASCVRIITLFYLLLYILESWVLHWILEISVYVVQHYQQASSSCKANVAAAAAVTARLIARRRAANVAAAAAVTARLIVRRRAATAVVDEWRELQEL